jgi:hypothetical protein
MHGGVVLICTQQIEIGAQQSDISVGAVMAFGSWKKLEI